MALVALSAGAARPVCVIVIPGRHFLFRRCVCVTLYVNARRRAHFYFSAGILYSMGLCERRRVISLWPFRPGGNVP